MRYHPLGNSGLVVSIVGLGCNNVGRKLDLAATTAVVDAAADVGITLLDTSDAYGEPRGRAESVMGEALQGRRDFFVLATKFGLDVDGANGPDFGARGSRRYIRQAIESSLRRLRTDYIDLYQLHAPDPVTPVEETVDALDELVREGKVRYLGHSNLAAWQVADAHWIAATSGASPFISAQNEYSLLERAAETELIPACERFGLGLLPYFPLARGLLTGKYSRSGPPPVGSKMVADDYYITEDKLTKVEALSKLANGWGVSLLEIAMGGLAARPAVASVIAGATSADQVRANAAAGLWEPTAEQLAAIDVAVPGPGR